MKTNILPFQWDYKETISDNLITLIVLTKRNVAHAWVAIDYYRSDEVKERWTALFHFVRENERTLQGCLERGELL